MKNLLRSSLAIAIGLSLAACGDSSSNNGTSTVEFDGEFVKGQLRFANVELFLASDFTFANALANTKTDDKGMYVLPYTGVIDGAYVIRATTDADSEMICDAESCGDTARGVAIPGDQLTNLELTTIIVPSDSLSVTANGNALTTMATQTIQAAVQGVNSFDLDSIDPAVMTSLQKNASAAIGSLIGVNLDGENIFSINIVDASDTAAALATSGISASLSLFNGSLAGLAGSGESLATELNTYIDKVQTVATTVFVSDNSISYSTLVDEIIAINTEIIAEVNDLQDVINVDVPADQQIDSAPIVVDDTVLDAIDTIKGNNPITGITGVTGAT